MLLPRRPAPSAEQVAAAGRVQRLLAARSEGWRLPEAEDTPAQEPADGGWTPTAGPPAPGGPPDPWGPTSSLLARGQEAGPVTGQQVVPERGADPAAAPPVAGAHRVPGVLDRLRAGRLDPGRRAVLGLAVVAALACLLAGLVVVRSAPREVALPEVERTGAPVEGAALPAATVATAEPALLVVAVAGEVRRPGLVRLPPGSRVDDALRAAGGLAPGADVGLLNLARKLVDGEQVLVGVEAPPGAAPPAGEAPAPAAGAVVVDLNAAGVAELDALPGIGPVLAQRIVDHRTRNGPFRSVDQLREVSGIGEAKYTSLRELVRV